MPKNSSPAPVPAGLEDSLFDILRRHFECNLGRAEAVREILAALAGTPSQEEGPAGVDLEAIEGIMATPAGTIAAPGFVRLLVAENRRLRAQAPASSPRDPKCAMCEAAGRLASDGLYRTVEALREAQRVCKCKGSGDGVHPPKGETPSEAAPKYATTTQEWEARLNAGFLEGVHDILVWSGCYTGDCPHHDQKECDAHVLEVGKQVAVEFLQDPAPGTAIEKAARELTKEERRKEIEAFNDWAWNKQGESLGCLRPDVAAKEAWLGRASLSSLPQEGAAGEGAADILRDLLAWMRGRPDGKRDGHAIYKVQCILDRLVDREPKEGGAA